MGLLGVLGFGRVWVAGYLFDLQGPGGVGGIGQSRKGDYVSVLEGKGWEGSLWSGP